MISTKHTMRAVALCAALALPGAALAVEVGAQVDPLELPRVSGGTERILSPGAAAQVLVFVKTDHPRCLEALRELAAREGLHENVRWLAVLPDDTGAAAARALASAAKVRMTMVLDPGDRLYAKLGIALHPTLVILDRGGRVTASVPYRAVQFGERVTAHVRFTLGEISAAELARATDPGKTEDRAGDGAAGRHEQFAARLLEQGQLEVALVQVNKALAIAPSGTAYCLQSKILGRLGRSDEATRAFEAAKRLETSSGAAIARSEPSVLGKDRSR
jgi:hypothetical protein